MMASGSARQMKGFGLWLCSARKRLMAAWRSTMEWKTPCFRRRRECVRVDAVLGARRDHQHAEAQDIGHAVDRADRVARVVDAGREPPGDMKPPLDFTQRHKPRI